MLIPADPAKVASGEITEGKFVGLCRDCRHWSKGDFSVCNPPDDKGSCVAVRQSYTNKASTAFGYDLFTDSDFGCTLFSPKDQP